MAYKLGGTGNDILTGTAAADTLNGGTGADIMRGGKGSDTYIVDNVRDQVIEVSNLLGGGVDLVRSWVSFTLGAYVENLTLGGSANLNGTGNAANNVIVGNAGANVLTGGGGRDALTGGAGNDTFVMTGLGPSDVLRDFTSTVDKLAINMTATSLGNGISIGNGDNIIDNAASGVSGSFSSTAELVIFTYNTAGAGNATNAAWMIDSSGGNFNTNDTRLFVLDSGVDTAVYLFTSSANDAQVSANELTLLCTMTGTASTVAGDYLFVA